MLHLVDLDSGKLIFTSAFENPQRIIDGNDVISRIMYDREKPNALYKELISCINEKISKMPCDEDGYLVNGKVFKIIDRIQITQNAVKGENGLMWSKAAISLGIKVLLEEAGISTNDLDKVYLAGSFGSYIDKESARRIGLVPAVPLKK